MTSAKPFRSSSITRIGQSLMKLAALTLAFTLPAIAQSPEIEQ